MPATEKDTGLGTTYERVAVARLLSRVASEREIATVLEGPTDGITGISGLNSVPLAQRGADVELVLGSEDEVALARRAWDALGLSDRLTLRVAHGDALGAAGRKFDLVWNFNSLPQVADADRLLDEMCEASARYVMVFVSNTKNYGFPIHRLHHRAARDPWSHGNISVMNARVIADKLSERGFEIVEKLLVDTPWWPDIDSPIEEVAATFLPFLRKRLSGGTERLEHYTWTIDTLPYFDDRKLADLLEEIEKHFVIERSKLKPLKLLFAHHRGVLAERRGGDGRKGSGDGKEPA
jgi:hypothetical protein